MGKPQPLKIPVQKAPSLVPSTSNAIRIQRVTFPWEQQFIKTSCVCRRTYVFWVISMQCIELLRFFFLLYHIPSGVFLCVKCYAVREKCYFPLEFVAKIEKKRYNDSILKYALGKYAMQFDRKGRMRTEIFYLRVSCKNSMEVFL